MSKNPDHYKKGRKQQGTNTLADIEGRNTKEDNVTRLKPPPTLDSKYENKMFVVVDGDDGISITGEGGIVESYAVALDNKLNPENQPE